MSKNTPESQKTEYKSSWQDEYFQWICGYANAKGGKLYVGVNDDGYVVGLRDTRYLLDTLPNQVVDTMGIVVEVDHENAFQRGENIKYTSVSDDIGQKPENLYVRGILTEKAVSDIDSAPDEKKNVTSDVQKLFDAAPGLVKQLRQNKDYREKVLSDIKRWQELNPIVTNPDGSLDYVVINVDPYPYGINFHNHFYIRSGGTTRELKGIALSAFLMEKAGKHWDGMPVPGMKVSDLDASAIQVYRDKAVEKGRHTKTEVNVSNEQIISDLKLIDESVNSDRDLMRAAMLMFHSDPEKWVTGASVKIAYFAPEGAYGANKSDDIIYHDEIHGPLILQADKVVDLVYTKYLKALVSYDGLQRIETFLTPKEAFREVILNAINHKLYESGNPIQISVYEDQIVVFNQGNWPEDIDPSELYTKKHSSYPHNPNIAKTFFNAGEIEAYGSGFGKIQIICDEQNAPYPELEVTQNGVTVIIKACERYMNLLRHGRYWNTYPDNKERIVDYLETEKGEIITDSNGAPIIVETERDVDPAVFASIDYMMEILAAELKESEKEIYLPIVEYLKTHDTIKNADVQRLIKKKDSSANRYLTKLVELGVLIPEGNNKGRIYRRAPGDKS